MRLGLKCEEFLVNKREFKSKDESLFGQNWGDHGSRMD
jgi:hypothetical protein